MLKKNNYIFYILAIATGLGVIVCAYNKEFYYAFKGLLLILFLVMMILHDKPINKNGIATRISIVSIVILVILFIVDKLTLVI